MLRKTRSGEVESGSFGGAGLEQMTDLSGLILAYSCGS